MRLTRLIFGLACALLMGAAAQPASAQRRYFNRPPRMARQFPAARAARFARPNSFASRGNFVLASNGFGSGQEGRRAARPPNENRFKPRANAATQGANRPGGGQGNGRGMAGLPPKWVENLRNMSPEEQERFMRNNQRFQSLPPERQAQVRQNLQKWNRLSPTERNAIRDRERVWEQMSPQQREHVKDDLLPKWQQMPPDRKQLLMGRLHTLQGMTPADRQAALNDPKFMEGLNPDEQGVLRDLNSLRNP